VPINQDPPFQPKNANLVGAAVTQSQFGRIVEQEVRIDHPIDRDPISEPEWANPADLQLGVSYSVSRETPVMPSSRPEDPLAAISEMTVLPGGGRFTVLRSVNQSNVRWYRVVIPDSIEGWINSIALVGQEIQIVQGAGGG
jgi:hypothetical protein